MLSSFDETTVMCSTIDLYVILIMSLHLQGQNAP